MSMYDDLLGEQRAIEECGKQIRIKYYELKLRATAGKEVLAKEWSEVYDMRNTLKRVHGYDVYLEG